MSTNTTASGINGTYLLVGNRFGFNGLRIRVIEHMTSYKMSTFKLSGIAAYIILSISNTHECRN